MTPEFLRWLCGLIEAGDVHPFYVSSEWRRISQEVKQMDHNECVICKARGRYRRADLVHHVNHLRRAPSLALDIWFTDAQGQQQRNLVSVCRDCHETVCHPERMRKAAFRPPLTAERWD